MWSAEVADLAWQAYACGDEDSLRLDMAEERIMQARAGFSDGGGSSDRSIAELIAAAVAVALEQS